MCKKVLVIKEANFSKEKLILEKMGLKVSWEKNFQNIKKILSEENFDLLIIGNLFLHPQNKGLDCPYIGKSGKNSGINFIKENLDLLENYIKKGKIILYSWNKSWKKDEASPYNLAKRLDIKFLTKEQELFPFKRQMFKLFGFEEIDNKIKKVKNTEKFSDLKLISFVPKTEEDKCS